MLGNLSGWHMIIILFVILLLFGAPKLPGLAKSLGQSMRILKKEVRQTADDDAGDAQSTQGQTKNEADGSGSTGADSSKS